MLNILCTTTFQGRQNYSKGWSSLEKEMKYEASIMIGHNQQYSDLVAVYLFGNGRNDRKLSENKNC